MSKRFFWVVCLFFILVGGRYSAQAAQLTPRQLIFYYAQQGNFVGLERLKQMGHPIDVSDEYGNSALCEAVIKSDKRAIQTLIQAGADTNTYCMQALSASYRRDIGLSEEAYNRAMVQRNYKEYLASKEAMNVPNPPIEWSTNKKVLVGLGVTAALIGGGIALATSGGGGGGSKKLKCVDGKQVGNACQCNPHAIGKLCDSCESGYGMHHTTSCHADLTCKTNAHQEADSCVCNAGYPFEGTTSCYVDLGCDKYTNMEQSVTTGECVCKEMGDGKEYIRLKEGCFVNLHCDTTKHLIQSYDACVCDRTHPVPKKDEEGKVIECYTTKGCAHGEQVADECICEEGWAGNLCTICDADNDYAMLNGTCVKVSKNANKNNDTISILNDGTGGSTITNSDIYGLFYSETGSVKTGVANAWPSTADVTASIVVKNSGRGEVYGVYGSGTTATGAFNSTNKKAESKIRILNTGNASYSIFGIYGEEGAYGVSNSGNSVSAPTTSDIKISDPKGGTSYGIYSLYGPAYGVYDNSTSTSCSAGTGGICSRSTITMRKDGGNSYGIYSAEGNVYSVYDTGVYTDTTKTRSVASVINMYQIGGVGVGISGKQRVYSSDAKTETELPSTVESSINMTLVGGVYELTPAGGSSTGAKYASGSIVGMMSSGGSVYNTKTGEINLNLIGGDRQETRNGGMPTPVSVVQDDTQAFGIYAPKDVSVTNAGKIKIFRSNWTDNQDTDPAEDDVIYTPGEKGRAYGIYVEGGNTASQTIKNSGTIEISGNYDNAYGIYVANGKNVNIINLGTIDIKMTEPGGYGIYVASNSSQVTITNGEDAVIRVGSLDCTGSECDEPFSPLIYLNEGSFVSSSLFSTVGSVNLDDWNGNVYAKKNAVFDIKNSFAGTLIIDPDLTTSGFEKEYYGKDMIKAGNVDGLVLRSGSALFDAKLSENKHDVIMTMKDFNKVVKNTSLANFLQSNYNAKNNEDFYNKLKSFDNMKTLTNSLNKLTGYDMLSRFNFEDMMMMKELNFDMNDKLFNSKENHLALAGFVSPMAFRGDIGSNSRYSLFNKREGNKSIGLGVVFTDIKSDDTHDKNDRKETMYQLVLPMGYKTHGFNFVVSPRLGYARGTYERTGFNNESYDGVIEKRVFGLMNEVRYPLMVGKWHFEPSLEFNVLGYQQKGHEDKKEYSLNIQNQNTYSVEGGIGLYTRYEEELNKDSLLKLNAGMAVYHEFADPYKVRVGMTGMDGFFTLRDEKRSDNRGVIRAGFDYSYRDLSLYGSLTSYIDKEERVNARTGMRYEF